MVLDKLISNILDTLIQHFQADFSLKIWSSLIQK